MAYLQNYREELLLATFCQVQLNSKEVSYPAHKISILILKLLVISTQKNLRTKLLENSLIAKDLIYLLFRL